MYEYSSKEYNFLEMWNDGITSTHKYRGLQIYKTQEIVNQFALLVNSVIRQVTFLKKKYSLSFGKQRAN